MLVRVVLQPRAQDGGQCVTLAVGALLVLVDRDGR
jgi:hypothetical protein